MPPHELPVPDAAALASSTALSARIREEIARAGGWIDFARYMDLALHAPGLGYYAAGTRKFGAGGDFVTAPELGPLFARTLARQLAEIFGHAPANVLELGAGSGALAAELLAELAALGASPNAYSILETSASLRERQRERLGPRVAWLDALPARFSGVVIANEVADAIPVRAVAWTGEGFMERGVTLSEDSFAWGDRAAPPELSAAVQALGIAFPADTRYESEIGIAAHAWMASLCTMLERGAIVVADYGFPRREYYHPQRSMGTLMCHYRHRSHGDVFLWPGLQDVTAHVDFTALAEAAHDAGLDILGYAPQASFLAECGLVDVLAKFDASDVRAYAPRAAEAHTLMSPAEMGELFKVLAVGRGVPRPLLGFRRGDRTGML